MMKYLENLTFKELRQKAKEFCIKGRSKMNKEQLVFALETRKEEKNANQETNQNKTNQNTKKEAEIRIWADVLKTMPNGTPVRVKFLNKDKKYIKEKTGILTTIKIEHKNKYLKVVKSPGRSNTIYLIENNDSVHFYITERDYKKIRYGGSNGSCSNKPKKVHKK